MNAMSRFFVGIPLAIALLGAGAAWGAADRVVSSRESAWPC